MTLLSLELFEGARVKRRRRSKIARAGVTAATAVAETARPNSPSAVQSPSLVR